MQRNVLINKAKQAADNDVRGSERGVQDTVPNFKEVQKRLHSRLAHVVHGRRGGRVGVHGNRNILDYSNEQDDRKGQEGEDLTEFYLFY